MGRISEDDEIASSAASPASAWPSTSSSYDDDTSSVMSTFQDEPQDVEMGNSQSAYRSFSPNGDLAKSNYSGSMSAPASTYMPSLRQQQYAASLEATAVIPSHYNTQMPTASYGASNTKPQPRPVPLIMPAQPNQARPHPQYPHSPITPESPSFHLSARPNEVQQVQQVQQTAYANFLQSGNNSSPAHMTQFGLPQQQQQQQHTMHEPPPRRATISVPLDHRPTLTSYMQGRHAQHVDLPDAIAGLDTVRRFLLEQPNLASPLASQAVVELQSLLHQASTLRQKQPDLVYHQGLQIGFPPNSS